MIYEYLKFTYFVLFFVGVVGICFNRKSILIILMSIEIIILSVNILFLTQSFMLDDSFGQLISIYVLTVAAAESAIGLAVLVSYYRIHKTIMIESATLLQSLKACNSVVRVSS